MEDKKEITLKLSHLAAASIVSAKNDVRFYLTGVLVGRGVIAATNGHCGLICDEPETQGIEIIVPRLVIQNFLKKIKKTKGVVDEIQLRSFEDGLWIMSHLNSEFELFRPIEGKFHDIQKIDILKPTEPPKTFVHFRAELIRIFSDVGKFLGISDPLIFPRDDSAAAYVEFNDDVHGLLMPMRDFESYTASGEKR